MFIDMVSAKSLVRTLQDSHHDPCKDPNLKSLKEQPCLISFQDPLGFFKNPSCMGIIVQDPSLFKIHPCSS